jgi:hypothetical protein
MMKVSKGSPANLATTPTIAAAVNLLTAPECQEEKSVGQLKNQIELNQLLFPGLTCTVLQ